MPLKPIRKRDQKLAQRVTRRAASLALCAGRPLRAQEYLWKIMCDMANGKQFPGDKK